MKTNKIYKFQQLFTNNIIKLTPKTTTTIKLNEIVKINNERFQLIDIN